MRQWAPTTGETVAFLKRQKRKNGRTYLQVVRSYRDESGKTRSMHVGSLGYLDALAAEHGSEEAALEWARAEAGRLGAERFPPAGPAKVAVELDLGAEVPLGGPAKTELGALVADAYLWGDLGLGRFFDNRRKSANLAFDAMRALELLVCDRILHPSSKRGAWEGRESFPRECDFSLEQVYECLTYLDSLKSEIVSWMDSSIRSSRGGRDTRLTYYDVTNYFFETDLDDDEGLRKRGCSKEHRPRPIVQMGLMLDRDGIPLDFDLFEGNTPDCRTLAPFVKAAKARHGSERAVVVADRGLNCAQNVAEATLAGDGFVFSKSVRTAPAADKRWVTSPEGYVAEGENFKVKGRTATRRFEYVDAEGAWRALSLEVREVAFWSRDYAERAAHEREDMLAKAQALVDSPSSWKGRARRGAGKYVKSAAVVPGTGEAAKDVLELDLAKAESDAALDGYCLVVTSETSMSDDEVVDAYRGLWRIEESFKTLKGCMSARPVFVRTPEHIRAHFLVCFIALTVMRLMQADTGWAVPSGKASEELSKLDAVHVAENYYQVQHRSAATDALCAAAGLDLTKRYVTKSDVKDLAAKARKGNRAQA